jgi:neutral ceramidase
MNLKTNSNKDNLMSFLGPITEVNFMGYAVPGQRGSGIHLRLRSRAFVASDDKKLFCFVSVDGGMGSDLVKMRVLETVNAALKSNIFSEVNLT